MTSTDWKLLRTPLSSTRATFRSNDDPLAWPEREFRPQQNNVAVAIGGTSIHRYAPGKARQAQARNPQLAALDSERRRVAAKRDLPPTPARRPEIHRVSRAGRGEADFADPLVKGQSDEGIQERIAR